MAIRFARHVDKMGASELAAILKFAERPEIISFAGGLPAAELFPVEALREINNAILNEEAAQSLQYGPSQGILPLRKKIAERMNDKLKTSVNADDIIITNGSQQGLDFVAEMFIDEGDVIVMESPSYLGAIGAFNLHEPKFMEIGHDEDGILIADLEEALKTNDRIKMIYVIPDFQNPTGNTWSMARRKEFMAVVKKYQIPVIEDNPYGELRFEGELLPSLMSMDTDNLVVFLGTFSKIFCPGLRVAWACAREPFMGKLLNIKEASDLHSSSMAQRQVLRFMTDYDLDGHIEEIKKVYKRRKDVMVQALKDYFPKECTFTNPEGGLFSWAELPEYINTKEMMAECVENGVAYVPGGPFYPNGGHNNTMRLNYSCMDEEKTVEGIKRIGEVIHRRMKK